LDALLELVEAPSKEAEDDVVQRYRHLPVVKSLQDDRELLSAWRAIEEIQDSNERN
jgi:hypothetical protein